MVERNRANRQQAAGPRPRVCLGRLCMRRGSAWLVLVACVAATIAVPLSATPLVSLPTYTSPTEMDGTNPQLISGLTLSTSGTDVFQTLAMDGQFSWTATGITWSGNPITPAMLTVSNFVATNLGDLYRPLNSPSPLTVTLTPNPPNQANFNILTNGDVNTGVAYATAPIGTMDFTVDADVRSGTFTFAFTQNVNFSSFTEPTTFNPVAFNSGGGSITVVPEPGGIASVVGLTGGGTAIAASVWRKRRRRIAGERLRG